MLFNKARAEAYMRKCDVDVLIATSPVSITYFSDYFCWMDPTFKGFMLQPGASSDLALPGYAVFPLESDPALVILPVVVANAADVWVQDVRTFGATGVDADLTSAELPDRYRYFHDLLLAPATASTAVEALAGILEDRGLAGSRVGLEMDGLSPAALDEIRNSFPQAQLLDCSNLIRLIRMVKSEEEVKRLTRSAEINKLAGTQAMAAAKPGVSLQDLARIYRTVAGENGADFDHLCIGMRGLGIVTEPDYRLAEDDVMMVDYGCIYQRYFSDTGYTFCMSEPSEPLSRRLEALQASVGAGVDAIRPGVRSSVIREAMWQTLDEHGFTASYPHGHGLGLEVRDYPTIVPDNGLRITDDCVDEPSDLPMEENMVINLESSMFLPGVASFQVEETYIVTGEGCRMLVP